MCLPLTRRFPDEEGIDTLEKSNRVNGMAHLVKLLGKGHPAGMGFTAAWGGQEHPALAAAPSDMSCLPPRGTKAPPRKALPFNVCCSSPPIYVKSRPVLDLFLFLFFFSLNHPPTYFERNHHHHTSPSPAYNTFIGRHSFWLFWIVLLSSTSLLPSHSFLDALFGDHLFVCSTFDAFPYTLPLLHIKIHFSLGASLAFTAHHVGNSPCRPLCLVVVWHLCRHTPDWYVLVCPSSLISQTDT